MPLASKNGVLYSATASVKGVLKASIASINSVVAATDPGWQMTGTLYTTGAAGSATNYGRMTIVSAVGGTLTQLRIAIQNQAIPANVKLALYNSSKVKIAETVAALTSGNGYFDRPVVTPVVVASGTFYLAWQAENANVNFGYAASVGSSYRSRALAYASFPEDPTVDGTNFGTLSFDGGFYLAA